ncbi:hypothetical protein [Vibrio rumoiensis]|uniref:hypothetical protein n=1 Tax=Vibrio rumoiensis TaxID=76258 RepID=UPI003AA98AA3
MDKNRTFMIDSDMHVKADQKVVIESDAEIQPPEAVAEEVKPLNVMQQRKAMASPSEESEVMPASESEKSQVNEEFC